MKEKFNKVEKLEKEWVKFVIIHHSNRIFDCPLFIKLRHKFIRKWEDTGYHFIIGNGVLTQDGKIYKGRPASFVGAHTYGYNKVSIGICLIGNFDCCKPTFKQYRSLVKLINKIKEDYQIKKVLGHNETEKCHKTCPGTLFPLNKLKNLI